MLRVTVESQGCGGHSWPWQLLWMGAAGRESLDGKKHHAFGPGCD